MSAISNEELIRAVRKQAAKLGRSPKASEFKHSRIARYRYSSWNNFLKESGLEIGKRSYLSDEQLLQEIQKLAAKLERTPTRNEFKHYQTAYSRFGSWDSFIERAGLTINQSTVSKVKLDKQTLIQELLKVSEDLGETPRINEFPYSYEATKQFGSWSSFIDASGLKRRSKRRVTNQELLSALQQKAEELGRIPDSSEIANGWEAARRFGTWQKFLEVAGLVPTPKTAPVKAEPTKEELIQQFVAMSNEQGETLRMNEFPNKSIAVKQFGYWSGFIKATGLSPRKKNMRNEELIRLFQAKAAELDHVPTPEEFSYSDTAIRRFKTWTAFLEKTGVDS